MEMMSAFYHEGQAKLRASAHRRHAKYGGEQKTDAMFDLSEPAIPGVLTKKIVRPGDGELAPIGAKILMHYTGKLQDGTEFDTSVGRGPLSFKLGQGEVIRGWDYAASTMSKGERCILTVGPEYGYGASETGPIPANSTLTFEMQMVDFVKPEGVSIIQWVGALVVLGIIYYVLFVPDYRDKEVAEQMANQDSGEL